MQKKILSAVLALALVGSASAAFADSKGGYWRAPTYDVDIDAHNSFNKQSDDDYFDLDMKNSFNSSKTVNVDKSFSADVDVDVDVTKDSHNTYTKVKQGNYVGGHIVVQQFGGSAGGSGDVISVDNSINYSKINSFNTENSWNRDYTSTYNSSSRTDIDIDLDIHDSFNKTSSKTYMRVMKKHGN
jgi:hypothetical protein